jgi:hypothetical protein
MPSDIHDSVDSVSRFIWSPVTEAMIYTSKSRCRGKGALPRQLKAIDDVSLVHFLCYASHTRFVKAAAVVLAGGDVCVCVCGDVDSAGQRR